MTSIDVKTQIQGEKQVYEAGVCVCARTRAWGADFIFTHILIEREKEAIFQKVNIAHLWRLGWARLSLFIFIYFCVFFNFQKSISYFYKAFRPKITTGT